MGQLKSLPVLMYHHVSERPGLVTVSPRTFRLQMEAIRSAGWKTLSLMEVEAFFQGAPFPKRSALITFDDGYADNYVHAFPVLEALGFHATIFLVTSLVREIEVTRSGPLPNHGRAKEIMRGNHPEEAILTWPEIERMRKSGLIDFASHAHTHISWGRVRAHSEEGRRALQEDLSRSAALLQERLGAPCRHLCWPWGDYDDEMIAMSKRSGFRYFYTIERGPNLPLQGTDRIKRFVMKEKPAGWLKGQLMIYSRPLIAKMYSRLRGAR